MGVPRRRPGSLTVILSAVAISTAASTAPGAAQLIPVRTVPVASGDQFRLVPSASMGMGGTRYAVDDSLADAWNHPARGGAIGSTLFLGSPTFYGISDDGGGGRSFPVSGLFTGSQWFGGASLALQQVENDPGGTRFCSDVCCFSGRTGTLDDQFGRNVYASGFAGRRLGGGAWSVGIGTSVARLEAMDGVDLLYAGATSIEQSGDILDLRASVERQGETDRIGAVVALNRVSMTHDVTYDEWIWNDSLQEGSVVRRLEKNQDHTRTFATQLLWDRRLAAPGWRIGASATLNYKDHPKIPNYSIQNIPRDPGTTWAFEAGFGVSRSDERTTFALDVGVQPTWSDTWQNADSTDVDASEGRLEEGDRSIENEFSFLNFVLRTGLSHRVSVVELQAGLDVRSYGYTLEQYDWVDVTRREQDEAWTEWAPTFGAALFLDALDVRYALRLTNGTGTPGLARQFPGPGLETLAGLSNDFILAPGAPLTLEPARVVTHQISVVIPVR
jgi:hypothetical protein